MRKVNQETRFACNDYDHDNNDINLSLKEMFTQK